MTLHRIAAALLLGAVVGAHAAEPVIPQTPEAWRSAAVRDIEEGYRLAMENHPGVHDANNPDFVKHLTAARDGSLALARQINDAQGYLAAMLRFNVLVHDGHAGMVIRLDKQLKPARWPGFVAVWRGDGMYVYRAQDGGPPVGAKIVSCDGRPIEQLMRDNLFAFQGRVEEAGQWWSIGQRVFADSYNPFIQLPQQCDFVSNGKHSSCTLAWQEPNDQSRAWRNEAYNGDRLPVGLTEPRKNLFWVAMPTFGPNAEERAAYQAINDQVRADRARYLAADAVVIDLRHNQGGNSMWSQNFAKALWGEGRVERRLGSYFAKTETWYRTSPGNTEHFRKTAERAAEEKQGELEQWSRNIYRNMLAAQQKGEKFWVRRDEDPVPAGDPRADLPGDPPPFTKPVYVIVPGQCASACLDALDVFTQFPNTKLIGAPSSADSTYMEIRIEDVSSGLAGAILPTKVYVARPRGNGVIYKPAFEMRELDWSTQNFLKAVEADLARK